MFSLIARNPCVGFEARGVENLVIVRIDGDVIDMTISFKSPSPVTTTIRGDRHSSINSIEDGGAVHI